MPQYFFNVAGDQPVYDMGGVELPNHEAARSEAAILAAAVLGDDPKLLFAGGLRIEVKDKDRVVLFIIAVSLTEAPA